MTSIHQKSVEFARTNTTSQYHKRLRLALAFIDDNLNTNIKLKDVASASYFSPYHFHRIFRVMMGETLNDYISRRRLEASANFLLYVPEFSITEISLCCNYSSVANYSKAFKKHFGVTPSQFRDAKEQNSAPFIPVTSSGKLEAKYGMSIHLPDLYPKENRSDIQKALDRALETIQIQSLNAFKAVSLRSDNGYELDSVLSAWDQLTAWARQNCMPVYTKKDLGYFGICYDNISVTPFHRCRYDAAFPIPPNLYPSLLNKIEPPFDVVSIPEGQYLSIFYQGEVAGITELYKYLLSEWMPNNNWFIDAAPLEKCERFPVGSQYREMKIFMKVQRRS